MRDAIARPVYQDLSADSDLAAGTIFLDGVGAAGAQLRAALAEHKPGLIVTPSHGQTYPLDNVNLLAEGLGLPVDQDFSSVQIRDLLSGWQARGTIWYSHACCSAGSCSYTLFDGLFDTGSELDRVLKGVTKLGSRVAPLPTALLGAKRPARAFSDVWNWTLRNPDTRQLLTDALRKSLYRELYQPHPIGQAFRRCYDQLGSLYTMYDADLAEFGRGGSKREAMLKDLICSRDVQSIVILGDPTAALPL